MNESGVNKITESETLVFTLLLVLPVDIMGFFIDWTGIGLIFVPFIKGAASAITYFFFKGKGGGAGASKQAAKLFGKYIGVNAIPLWPTTTTLFLLDVYMHNHPEKFKAVNAVGALGKADINVTKLKEIRETKGTLAAAREVHKQYRTVRDAMEETGAEEPAYRNAA